MGDAAFALLGYEVVSRKAAADDGSRSAAEADVAVGGEVLRGTASGFGPVDALQAALRSALEPAFPVLADVALVDFSSGLAERRGDGTAPVRVTVTAKTAEGGSFEGVGTAGDLLHASWLAVGSAFLGVVAGRAPAAPARVYPSVRELGLAPVDEAVLSRVDSTDWATTVLDAASKEDRWFAAQALELGATVVCDVGVLGHPRVESVQRINLQLGRPVNQVGSLTTTRPHFEALFDWDALPEGVSKQAVLAMFDACFELGPMGFRGPAAWSITQQLWSFDADVKTALLVGPGYRCPSNRLIDQALGFIGRGYLFAAPGRVDLAGEEGVVVIGHSDEAPPVLAFHRLVDGGLVLERAGSLDAGAVREVVESFGFGLVA